MCVHEYEHVCAHRFVCACMCVPIFNSDYMHDPVSGVNYLIKSNLTARGYITEKYDTPPPATTNLLECGLISSLSMVEC